MTEIVIAGRRSDAGGVFCRRFCQCAGQILGPSPSSARSNAPKSRPRRFPRSFWANPDPAQGQNPGVRPP